MNILPKKSWHIWNKDNLARIARDEAEAARKEKEQAAKAARAEQEARLEQLKRKRGEGSADGADAREEHVNLFYKEEHEAALRAAGNPEYEEEARLKRKKEEDKVTVYLGQGSAEFSKAEPWYRDKDVAAKNDVTKRDDRAKRKHEKLLNREDPLVNMSTFLKQKAEPPPPPPLPFKLPATSSKAANDDIARLRQERLMREAEERARVAALKGLTPAAAGAADAARPSGKYFSQFNPHLAAAARPGGRPPPGAPRYSDKYRFPQAGP